MRLTLERDAFFAAVGKVRGAVAAKDTIPILRFVLLAASGERLNLTATNLDMQAKASAPAQVDAAGSVAAPAGPLYDVLRALPTGGEVALELTARGRLAVICGLSRVELPTLPASDFPAFAVEATQARGEVAAHSLARLIDRTRFAVSDEATRYYLGGIYLHLVDTESGPALRGVATNGHQLAYCDLERPEGLGDMPGVIMPKAYAAELRKALDANGEVSLAVGPAMIVAQVDGLELAGKVIDGHYPDYRRVIPSGDAVALTVAKDVLLGAIKRARIVIDDAKTWPLKLRFSDSGLTLEAVSYDRGSAVERVPAEGSGAPFERSFNAAYVQEMVELQGDQVALTFYDDGERLTVTNAADASALTLVISHVGG